MTTFNKFRPEGRTPVTLSQDQVDRYFEDGFITVPDAVSPALLAEIRRVTEEIVAGAASLAASDEKLDLEDSHTPRSEEHTSELQSLMRISYAVFCLKKNTKQDP